LQRAEDNLACILIIVAISEVDRKAEDAGTSSKESGDTKNANATTAAAIMTGL
jgi:hypothetical protein